MVRQISHAACSPKKSRKACPLNILLTSQAELFIHVYQPSEEGATEEVASSSGDASGEDVMAASICELPSRNLEGLWWEIF